jgi:hypothetical protein
MNHTCHLIALAISEAERPSLPCKPIEAVCAVTGTHGLCLPREDVVSNANCDGFLFVNPTSAFVHVDVFTAWNFGETKEGNKRQTHPERQSCWYCNLHEFRKMDKAAIRPIVLEGSLSSPWALWVTTSYKKHGSIRSPINHTRFGRVGFDEVIVDCSNNADVVSMWTRLRAAQSVGIPRPLIEHLDISPGYMAKLGWKIWRDFEMWARSRVRSPLYRLLTYLLPSQEELKNAYSDD